MTTRHTHAVSLILSRPLILVLALQSIVLFSNHYHYNNRHHVVAGAFTIKSIPQFSTFTKATTAAALSSYSPTITTSTQTSCAWPTYRTRAQLLLRSSNKNHNHICDNGNENNANDNDDTRRKFITTSFLSILSTTIPPIPANAALPAGYDSTEDLTSQIYNEDGTLKDAIEQEAKSRTVSIAFPTATTLQTAITSVDGIQVEPPPSNNTTTNTIEASYQLPEKWTPAPEYLDTLLSVQKKACDRIVIYQVPDRFEDYKTLDKASTVGVTKALATRSIVETGVFPENLKGADLIGGKKVSKAEGRKYYEFDLAVAPERCSKDGAENLGLGFCPYDTIVLFSATIIEGKMMVCGITCTRDEWKRSSADIKRVRESFVVGLTASAAVAVDETSASV